MVTLDDLAVVCRALLEAEEAEEKAELAAKEAKELTRTIREETIPTMMQEMCLSEVKLDTGQKVSVKQDVYASIPADGREAAYKWLDDHGYGGLIAVKVVTAFSRSDRKKADKLLTQLSKKGMSVGLDQSVNAQTLKAFLREQIAAGKDIPLDTFGARPVWVAKVK